MAVQPQEVTSSNIACLVREPRLWALLMVSLLLQLTVMAVLSENLTEDRDAYLSLSRQLAFGNGFRVSDEASLTAYRPPLYPVVLSIPMRFLSEATSVAAVNLLCSLLIVTLVWILARQHWNPFWSTLASGLVICDPLLLSNTTLPMTELLFTVLVLAFVTIAIQPRLSVPHRIALGVIFGLSALCRPTVWAFGIIAGIVWIVREWRLSPTSLFAKNLWSRALPVVVSGAFVISPWIIRNYFVFDAFIPMTTHGGYTLLLANNEVFYEEVVTPGWRTAWSGESLDAWQSDLSRAMNESLPAVEGEVAQSRWMSDRAQNTIRNNPSLFLKSCGTRILRFWNPVPLSTPSRPISQIVQWGIGLFSSVIFIGAILSPIIRKNDRGLSQWVVLMSWSLILSLTLVHAVYWSNARMRTPIEPLLILLAISSISSRSPEERLGQ